MIKKLEIQQRCNIWKHHIWTQCFRIIIIISIMIIIIIFLAPYDRNFTGKTSHLPPTTEEVCFRRTPAFVRLSVFVQDYSKMCAWIWMKCCVSTDVATWTNWLTFEPDPDYSSDTGTGLLSPIAYSLQCRILLRRKNPYWAHIAATMLGFESYALQRGILLQPGKSNVLVLGARRSSDAWFWGVETLLSEVNALYRVHF